MAITCEYIGGKGITTTSNVFSFEAFSFGTISSSSTYAYVSFQFRTGESHEAIAQSVSINGIDATIAHNEVDGSGNLIVIAYAPVIQSQVQAIVTIANSKTYLRGSALAYKITGIKDTHTVKMAMSPDTTSAEINNIPLTTYANIGDLLISTAFINPNSSTSISANTTFTGITKDGYYDLNYICTAVGHVIVNESTASTYSVTFASNKNTKSVIGVYFEPLEEEGSTFGSISHNNISYNIIKQNNFNYNQINLGSNLYWKKRNTEDTVAPNATYVQMAVLGGATEGYAKVGNKIWIYVNFSEALSIEPTFIVNGVQGSIVQRNTTINQYVGEIELTSSMTEGEIQFEISGYKDLAGNEGALINNANITNGVESIILDKTAPTVTISSSVQNDDGSYQEISLKLHDAIGCSHVTINGNELTRTGTWADLNYLNIKEYLITGSNEVIVYDLAGNFTSYTFNYTSASKPKIVLDVLNENGYTNNATVTITDSVEIDIDVYINDVFQRTWNDTDGYFRSSLGWMGQGTFKIVVTNIQGASSTVEFIHDNVAPVINDGNLDGNIYSTAMSIHVVETNLDKIEVYKNEVLFITKTTTDAFEVSADGDYEVIVTDKAGNNTTANFTIDKISPEVSYIAEISFNSDYTIVQNGDKLRYLVAFNKEMELHDNFLLNINNTTVKFTRSGNTAVWEYIAQYTIPTDEDTMPDGPVSFSITGARDLAGNEIGTLSIATHSKYKNVFYKSPRNLFDNTLSVNAAITAGSQNGIVVTNSYATNYCTFASLPLSPNTTYYIHADKEFSHGQFNVAGRFNNLNYVGILLDYNETDNSFTTGDTLQGNLYIYGNTPSQAGVDDTETVTTTYKNVYIGTRPYGQ